MKKQILTFFLFFFFAFGWCQNIEFHVIDSETQSPVSNTKILITDNQLNFSELLTTDEKGCVSFYIDDSIKSIENLHLRISRKGYTTHFTSISIKELNNKIHLFQLVKTKCEFQNIIFEYDTGKIYPNDEIYKKITSLVLLYKENPDLKFTMEFTYSKKEKNGYQLSIERANFLMDYMSNYEVNGEQIYLTINEGEKSVLEIKLLLK